jgi:Tfp pilus assembly protein PilO
MMMVRKEVNRAWLTTGRLEREAERIPGEMATLASRERELEAVLANLPWEEDIPEVMRDFAQRAEVRGLSVLDVDLELATLFRPEQEGPGNRVSKLPLRLLVLGSYAEIGRFLEDLAEQGSYVEWTSVTLDRSSSVRGAIEATISVNLYALTGASETANRKAVAMAGRRGSGHTP